MLSEADASERHLWSSVYAVALAALMADPSTGDDVDRSNAAALAATRAVQQMRLDFGERGTLGPLG